MVRIAIRIFCRKIIINKPAYLKESGPLLLACNHPNSFLDGVILDTLFEQPVYALARGDAFKNSFYAGLLASLKLLPVYRTSEGVENLGENYKTFDSCIAIFKKNGIVQIFSEGKCINEWRLRALKKGTARLAIASWDENIPLRVLPVGINYSSFRSFGKNVFINLGEIIEKKDIDMSQGDGLRHQAFNTLLEQQLKQLVFDIPKNDIKRKQELLESKSSFARKIILFIPAMIGFIINAPLYLPIKIFTWSRTKNNDHYDSVLTALLLFTYPIYLFLIMITAYLLTKSWLALLLLFAIPFTAWSAVQLKSQVDK
ncbi:MAG: 1-acyl-sn-glycerol-3-phosphate acyltransferase [Bacteroidota bacterium]